MARKSYGPILVPFGIPITFLNSEKQWLFNLTRCNQYVGHKLANLQQMILFQG